MHEPTGSTLVGKTTPVIFDEVAVLRRETIQTLDVQQERRVVSYFEYLIGMLYRDDEDGLLKRDYWGHRWQDWGY